LQSLEPDRDEWEMELFAAARKRDIPVLAICRGFQLVNVAFGGTLIQHVELDEGSGHPSGTLTDIRQRTRSILFRTP